MSTEVRRRLADERGDNDEQGDIDEQDDNDEQDIIASGLDIHIRLLEKKDCNVVVDMIYNLIYMGTRRSIAKDLIQQVDFLVFLMLTSLAVYYHTDSFVWANVCFISLPFTGYMYVAYWIGRNEYYGGEDTKKGSDFVGYWSDHDAGRYLYVAEYDGKVIGCVGAFNTSETAVDVVRMVTHPDYRGQKVAQKLMLALLLNCKSRGIEDAELMTSYKQAAAQKLYIKLGFNKIEDVEMGTRPFFVFMEFKYHLNLKESDLLN